MVPMDKPARRRSLWPFAAFWAVAMLFDVAIGTHRMATLSKEQAYLAGHDTSDGYLIPVECSMSSEGMENVDFIRGTVAMSGTRSGKDVCLYTRPAFNRLFPSLVTGDPAAAHQAQADKLHAELVRPWPTAAKFEMVMFAVCATVVFGFAACLQHRQNRRVEELASPAR